MFKSVGLQMRRDDLTHEGYVKHWLQVHAPMSQQVHDLQGYVANEVIRAGNALQLRRSHPEFGARLDGVANLHFATADGLKRMAERPEVQTWFSDGPNFVGQRTGFIAEEIVLRTPDRDGRPFKMICFLKQTDLQLVIALRTLAKQEAGGLVLAKLGAPTGSTNLAGFEVPEMDWAAELWGESESAVIAAAQQLAQTISARGELVGAVLAREWVIKPPPQATL